MQVKRFILGPALTNLYVVSKDDGHGFIVDCADRDESVDKYIKENDIKIDFILQTHTHFDHVLGLEYYKNLYDVYVYASDDSKEIANDKNYNLAYDYNDLFVPIDKYISDGEVITDYKILALKTPGHTIDSMSYIIDDMVFTGDSLFKLTIGRTDFPGGDYNALIDSIKNKLGKLDPDTIVYPGHRSETTIGYEKQYNQFFQ